MAVNHPPVVPWEFAPLRFHDWVFDPVQFRGSLAWDISGIIGVRDDHVGRVVDAVFPYVSFSVCCLCAYIAWRLVIATLRGIGAAVLRVGRGV